MDSFNTPAGDNPPVETTPVPDENLASEIAGIATVDSAPSERNSRDALNGLDADANGVHLPGPLVDLDKEE
jgi:hypothetical protein